MNSCASRTSSKENEETSSLAVNTIIEERPDLKESSPHMLLNTSEAPLQIDTSPSRSGAETKCLPPARTLDKNILIASSKINLTKEPVTTTTTTTTTAVKPGKQLYTCYHSSISENLTNQHLKCANTISKSSRSNSIDQLIAAAAVTAQSSACMSPLSPLNSPLAASQPLSNNSMFSLSGGSSKPATDFVCSIESGSEPSSNIHCRPRPIWQAPPPTLRPPHLSSRSGRSMNSSRSRLRNENIPATSRTCSHT